MFGARSVVVRWNGDSTIWLFSGITDPANLTGVVQGVQSRSFVYSSLSRLTSATNPESENDNLYVSG
ncbi:MAG: hypothetical protein DMG17_33100 [Acidobacteria bacterium]|nr:MAG: hypothetical protein DMG17_33100 [Acidobacteriota bacterium]